MTYEKSSVLHDSLAYLATTPANKQEQLWKKRVCVDGCAKTNCEFAVFHTFDLPWLRSCSILCNSVSHVRIDATVSETQLLEICKFVSMHTEIVVKCLNNRFQKCIHIYLKTCALCKQLCHLKLLIRKTLQQIISFDNEKNHVLFHVSSPLMFWRD